MFFYFIMGFGTFRPIHLMYDDTEIITLDDRVYTKNFSNEIPTDFSTRVPPMGLLEHRPRVPTMHSTGTMTKKEDETKYSHPSY